jgi:hypothetical protein
MIRPMTMLAALLGALGPRVVISGEGRKLLDRPVVTNFRGATEAELDSLALDLAAQAVKDPSVDDVAYYRAKRAELDAAQRGVALDRVARVSSPPPWDHTRPPSDGARARARRLKQAARIAAKRA